MTMHQGVLAGLVLLLGGSMLAGPLTRPLAGDSSSEQRRQQAPRPNIIFVLTLDYDVARSERPCKGRFDPTTFGNRR